MSSYFVSALSARIKAGTMSISVVRSYGWLFVGMAVLLLAPVALHPTAHYLGNPNDPQQTLWFLHWFWYALVHGQNPFISHTMNYPRGVDLMSNSADAAEAFLFGPLFYLVNDNFAYNSMLFADLCASGIFGALILHELGVRRWLAAVGGVLFEILPYTSAQINGHANLTVTAWLLGAAVVFLRVNAGKSSRTGLQGALTGVLLAGEFYTSLEVSSTFAAVVLTAVAFGLLFARRDTIAYLRRVPLRYLVCCVVVAVGLCLPGLYYFKYGTYSPGGSHIIPGGFPIKYSDDLLTYLLPTPIYRLHTASITSVTSHFAGNYAEQDGYIGIAAILLLLFAAKTTWHKGFTRVAMPLIAWLSILSLGIFLHVLGRNTFVLMPWALIAQLPIYSQALPARLMFYTDVLIVMVVIRATEEYLHRRVEVGSQAALSTLAKQRRRSAALLVTLFVAWFATWWPVAPVATAQPHSLGAIEPGGPLFNDLSGHPTLVLTDNFFQVMQGLERGGYAFPVANVYAFQNDTQAQVGYRPEELGWMAGLSGQALSNFIAGMVASTQVTRVAYIPIYIAANATPPVLMGALTALYGTPRVGPATGDAVWTVSAKTPAVWVGGDVVVPEALFEGPTALSSAAAGPSFRVTTRREGCEVTLTAPNHVLVNLTGAKTGELDLLAGQHVSLYIPANARVSFLVATPQTSSTARVTASVEVHLSPS